MKVVDRAPWFLFLLRQFIGQPPPTAIITYGRTIYRLQPDSALSHDLLVHEETHCRQQGRTPFVWWARYLTSASFRVAQEAEAYRAQLEAATLFDRHRRQLVLRALSATLAGPMYGNAVSVAEARRLIAG